MPEIVADTTPIIALAAVDQLHLLGEFYSQVIIPLAVKAEIMADGPIAVPDLDYLDYVQVTDNITGLEANLLYGLGEGEKQAILVALNRKIDRVLIDERKGRKVAARMGLTVVGALGILARAKREGWITNFRKEAQTLVRIGLYYDLKLIEALAREVD